MGGEEGEGTNCAKRDGSGGTRSEPLNSNISIVVKTQSDAEELGGNGEGEGEHSLRPTHSNSEERGGI